MTSPLQRPVVRETDINAGKITWGKQVWKYDERTTPYRNVPDCFTIVLPFNRINCNKRLKNCKINEPIWKRQKLKRNVICQQKSFACVLSRLHCTCCPLPVFWRCNNAARMAPTANRPVDKSTTATPVRHGSPFWHNSPQLYAISPSFLELCPHWVMSRIGSYFQKTSSLQSMPMEIQKLFCATNPMIWSGWAVNSACELVTVFDWKCSTSYSVLYLPVFVCVYGL